MHIRRALLFMPGDDRRKCEKGAALGPDSVIMDLEDGVALSNKAAGRATIAAVLREVAFGRTERLVRINPVGTPFWQDDIDETVGGLPDGYVLPKVEHPDQVTAVAERLDAAEDAHGLARNTIRLLAMAETAHGILNLREIATSSLRLDALVIGGEDLASDIGAIRTDASWEIFYARSALVLHARAFGLQAIDTVYVKLDDLDGLTRDTKFARQLGYTGRTAIHPRQIEPIQRIFTPTAEEIDRARRLIAEDTRHRQAGYGVFEFEGKMVDMPMIRAAETILARARAAGVVD